MLPESPSSDTVDLNRVLVAWDFSRPAARAVSDSIPILEKAREVFIVTVTNEKPMRNRRSALELAKNLSRHGVDVIVDEVDAAGVRSATSS